MSDFAELRRQRYAFLREMYDRESGGRDSPSLSEIGAAIGLTERESHAVARYLAMERLIEADEGLQAGWLNDEGIRALTDGRFSESTGLDYSRPSTNIIHARDIHNSPIQQGSAGPQSVRYGATFDPAALAELLASIRASLHALPLSMEDRREVEADVLTLEGQLTSSRPKASILRESLASIRAVLEGASGNVLAESMIGRLSETLSGLP